MIYIPDFIKYYLDYIKSSQERILCKAFMRVQGNSEINIYIYIYIYREREREREREQNKLFYSEIRNFYMILGSKSPSNSQNLSGKLTSPTGRDYQHQATTSKSTDEFDKS